MRKTSKKDGNASPRAGSFRQASPGMDCAPSGATLGRRRSFALPVSHR